MVGKERISEDAKPVGSAEDDRGSGSSGGSSSPGARFPRITLPISELDPKKWNQFPENCEIRGLVVCKSGKLTYRGGGCFFDFEIEDKHGWQVRVVGFDREYDKFYDQVIEDKEYVLARCLVSEPHSKRTPEGRKCDIALQGNSVVRAIDVEREAENQTLLERLAELEKALEICTSKFQQLKAEVTTGKMFTKAEAS